MFSPPKTTIIKACENNQFTTWSGLTSDETKKNLSDHALATDKCHMKRQHQGLKYTKYKVKKALVTVERNRYINPLTEQE